MSRELPIGLSNRHCHLTQEHIEILFGEGHQLTHLKDLSQPGQYAAQEVIDVKGPKGTISEIRILGPARPESQIEILVSDSYKLGVPVEIRMSGDLDGTPGAELIGPKGSVVIEQGVIVASRHLHISDVEAIEFGLKDKDVISVEVPGVRSLIFNNVIVRVSKDYALDLHVDIEEGNAAGLKNGQKVRIVE